MLLDDGNEMADKLFQQHEAARKAAEATTKRYESSSKDIGTKISTDKGGKTERLRAEHTV